MVFVHYISVVRPCSWGKTLELKHVNIKNIMFNLDSHWPVLHQKYLANLLGNLVMCGNQFRKWMFSPPEPPNNMIFLFCCLLMTQRETVLSRALLQTAPCVFLCDPARQEGLSGDNSGDGISLYLLEFSKFSCSKALCLIERWGFNCSTP